MSIVKPPVSINDGAGNPIGSTGNALDVNIKSGGSGGGGGTPVLTLLQLMDTPVLDTSSSNIPANVGSPLQVVASLTGATRGLQVNSTIGRFIGLYSGAVGAEVLKAVIGPGQDGLIYVSFLASARISLRSMDGSAIITGLLALQFYQ